MPKLRTTNPDGTPREMILGFGRAKLSREVERAARRGARKMVEGKEGEVRDVVLNIEADITFPTEWLPQVQVFLARLVLEEHEQALAAAMLPR